LDSRQYYRDAHETLLIGLLQTPASLASCILGLSPTYCYRLSLPLLDQKAKIFRILILVVSNIRQKNLLEKNEYVDKPYLLQRATKPNDDDPKSATTMM